MQKFDEIYEVVKLIPDGRVTSYGAIAKYLGTGARLVGWAMNAAHELNIPAHRVVNYKGLLTGKSHFGTGNEMQNLLENEGLVIKNYQIANFYAHFWDPSIELAM